MVLCAAADRLAAERSEADNHQPNQPNFIFAPHNIIYYYFYTNYYLNFC
jgi:hypothetical protein